MAGPRDITVRFLANVQGFLRGADDMEDALRDTARAQDTLADEGEDSARRLSRAYEKAGDRIRSEADATKRKSKQAYGDAGREIGGELAQNIGEGISSGSGDIRGAVLGTLGGIIPAFGAAAAAAGLGLVVAQALFANAEELRQRAKAAGREAFDALRDGMVEGSEQESIVAAALGLDSFDDVVTRAVELGQRLRVPADQIVTYWRTAGDVIGPELGDAFREAERAGKSSSRGMQGAAAETVAAVREVGGAQVAVNDALDHGRRNADALNASLATTVELSRKAAYYADRTQSSYAAGGSTMQQQLGAAARYVQQGRG